MDLKYSGDVKKIIEGCQKGQRKYQEILHQDLYADMLKLCLHYSKDEQEAKDYLYSGFLKLYEQLGKYNYKGSFISWTRRLFVNNILDKIRQAPNIYEYTEMQLIEDSSSNPDLKDYSKQRKASAQKIIKALQNIPKMPRTVFNLYVMEDLRHKEIGQILNISESASKSHLYRAKSLILKQLEE